jgi:hypothetical protein
MASSSDLFEDAPEDEDPPIMRMMMAAAAAPVSTSSVAPLSQDVRRRKRRRLFRLLKNPDMLPSFLRAIDAPQLVDSKEDATTTLPAVDDNDFLLEPPVVVIDVDEYLGLKKKREEEEGHPDAAMSGMVMSPPPVVSSSGDAAATSTALNDPADEGWYEGRLSMALPEDATYLSDIQQWTRQNLEYFSATAEDIQVNQAGRRTPTVRGKVGIRCVHCARAIEAQRQEAARQNRTVKISFPAGAVSYPLNFSSIHSISIQKPQLHFEKCPHMPRDSRLEALLRGEDTDRKRLKEGMTAQLYWAISCHRLGLVETSNGIRFGRDLSLDPLPFESTRANVEQENPQLVRGSQPQIMSPTTTAPTEMLDLSELPQDVAIVLQQAIDEEDNPNEVLALREDQYKLSSYMFVALKQASICHAIMGDMATRGKKTKLMRLGLTGFCCRHCKQRYPSELHAAQANDLQSSCRSFSSSSDTLAAAVSNSFILHLLKCPYTPQTIKQALQTLKRYHPRQMQQLPYGSQSQVFSVLWTRMRAMDKDFDPSEVAQQEALFISDTANRDDGEFVPDRVHSAKKAPGARRGRRSSVDDDGPVPERPPNFPVADDPETIQVLKDVEDSWDPEVNDNLILPEDRYLISDYVFLCMRQLRIALPTASDFRGHRRRNVINHMAGMCCIHCANLPGSQFIMPSGRTFPSAPDNMASAFNVS